MWGSQSSSMYKRTSSRDYSPALDVEDNNDSRLLLVDDDDDVSKETETTNPPWICSLPHVLVATLSSFLFGYHLGFVIIILILPSSSSIFAINDDLCWILWYRVVNEPLESISSDLGFTGNTLAEGIWHISLVTHQLITISTLFIYYNICFCWNVEGLVVSVCLGGAFIGSLFSGGAADGLGRRRAFQLSALPMILGAFVRYFCVIPFTILTLFPSV